MPPSAGGVADSAFSGCQPSENPSNPCGFSSGFSPRLDPVQRVCTRLVNNPDEWIRGEFHPPALPVRFRAERPPRARRFQQMERRQKAAARISGPPLAGSKSSSRPTYSPALISSQSWVYFTLPSPRSWIISSFATTSGGGNRIGSDRISSDSNS